MHVLTRRWLYEKPPTILSRCLYLIDSSSCERDDDESENEKTKWLRCREYTLAFPYLVLSKLS